LFGLFIAAIYSYHDSGRFERAIIPVYAGSTIAAVLAGDLLTLFVSWEISAIASALIIFTGKREYSQSAGMRYLLMHITSGLLLLLGSVIYYLNNQTIEFSLIGTDSIAGLLIFLAFGIKCAFPLLHSWLPDAYPQASPAGTVALSIFTTKLAVYCLARGYAGTDSLIWIGVAMAVFPAFYAIIENDLRRVLCYSLNSQLGFMVVGIGIGTPLALNGTVAHAFSSVLYQGLLFMCMGAVLYRVGTTRASELGGLYKSMPYTTALCIIGAMAISSFPLLSGFISKAIIVSAAAKEGYVFVWLALLFSSVAVFAHSGIKVPFSSFFGQDRTIQCKEAPINMLLAMGIAALACLLLGLYPNILYQYLPNPVSYNPYTFEHVTTQLQLLLFALLAFILLYRNGLYPRDIRSINLDTDWFMRKPAKYLLTSLMSLYGYLLKMVQSLKIFTINMTTRLLYQAHGPGSVIARGTSVGNMVIWVAVLLSACLIFYYL
jgi:multicomponent Na+:H+ antiporter subunit D